MVKSRITNHHQNLLNIIINHCFAFAASCSFCHRWNSDLSNYENLGPTNCKCKAKSSIILLAFILCLNSIVTFYSRTNNVNLWRLKKSKVVSPIVTTNCIIRLLSMLCVCFALSLKLMFYQLFLADSSVSCVPISIRSSNCWQPFQNTRSRQLPLAAVRLKNTVFEASPSGDNVVFAPTANHSHLPPPHPPTPTIGSPSRFIVISSRFHPSFRHPIVWTGYNSFYYLYLGRWYMQRG